MVQLCDLKNFLDLWRQTDHFHRAAFFYHAEIIADQFADAGTVEIFEAGQVENYILVALLEEAVDGVAKRSRFIGCEPPFDVHHGYFFRVR